MQKKKNNNWERQGTKERELERTRSVAQPTNPSTKKAYQKDRELLEKDKEAL